MVSAVLTQPIQDRAIGFLHLPGGEWNTWRPFSQLLIRCTEIRNMVYSYITEASTLKLKHDPSHSANTVKQDRKLLGLMQTCRQTRTELMSIYHKETTVVIPYYQINQYLNIFMNTQSSAQTDAVGEIVMLRSETAATHAVVDLTYPAHQARCSSATLRGKLSKRARRRLPPERVLQCSHEQS